MLELKGTHFPNDTLYEDWIQLNPQKHPVIYQMKIDGGVSNIGDNSFACLPDLLTLSIFNTGIASLRKGVFKNMPNLTNLELYDNQMFKEAESGLVDGLNLETLLLQTVQLNGNEAIKFYENVTKSLQNSKISNLDWSFNDIQFVTKQMLTNLKSLQQVYMKRSNIVEFEKGSLGNIASLKTLFLTENKIERLPEEIFKPVVEQVKGFYIFGNPLLCDCDMKWLQTFVLEEKEGYFGDINKTLCAAPENNANVLFLEAEMCNETGTSLPDTTNTPTAHTELPTTSSDTDTTYPDETTDTPLTPTSPPDGETIMCKSENSQIRKPRSANFSITTKKFLTIHLPKKKQEFNITEEDENIKIVISRNCMSDNRRKTLLWMNDFEVLSAEQSNAECTTDISTTTIYIPLRRKKTYLFCLLDTYDRDINLLDCMPYKTLPEKGKRAWLTNDEKMSTITTLAVVSAVAIISAIVIGAAIFYVLVRKNPALIKGSKRVIVVKRHGKAQVMVMPNGYVASRRSRTGKYTVNSSFCSESSSMMVNADALSTVSYISAIQPTPMEILNYRLQRLNAKRQEEEESEELPPPVPPYPMELRPRRLPPDVDLLLEYEWHTTTTTTTSKNNK